jgi:AcrR family transcriptional regulator
MSLQAGGRPRSERSRLAILAATRAVMAESRFQQVSMEGIARRAHVSKATIYRWWPSKAAVVLDAMRNFADDGGYPRFNHSGNTRQDLVEELRAVIDFYNSDIGHSMLDLIAESRFDQALADALRDLFIMDRRKDTVEVLTAGIASGEIRADLDLDPIMDAIWGAVYYKLLVSHTPLKPEYADQLFAAFWSAIAPPTAVGGQPAVRPAAAVPPSRQV